MVNCGCGLSVATRTSWTHENPGRKFIACQFYNHESGQMGCNTFEWVDEEILDWQRDVTNILIAEKHRLATDNGLLKSRLAFVELEKNRLCAQLEKLKKKTTSNRNWELPKDGRNQKQHFGIPLVVVSVIVSVVSLIFVKLFG